MFVTDAATARPKSAGKKTGALMVALIVHAVIAIVFTVIAVLPAMKEEPEIVAAVIAPTESPQQQKMQQKTVAKQASMASASASAAMTSMIRSNAAAVVAAPEVTTTSTSAIGLGEGDLGSGFGVGSGTGGGMGSGASFFGAKSTGKRFLFVLDHSGSMKKDQVALRNAELEKVLKTLNAGVQFHVLLFAGGGYYAAPGWSVAPAGTAKGAPINQVTDPKKKAFLFKPVAGYSDYDFEGSEANLPKAEWLPASASNVKQTIDFVREAKLFGGTDWGLALAIAHRMEPAPEVIYFMADGTGGNKPEPILQINRANGKPVINTIAMQTTAGAAEFSAVAKGTKGTFTIVAKDGSPVDGDDYLKDPAKYKAKIEGK